MPIDSFAQPEMGLRYKNIFIEEGSVVNISGRGVLLGIYGQPVTSTQAARICTVSNFEIDGEQKVGNQSDVSVLRLFDSRANGGAANGSLILNVFFNSGVLVEFVQGTLNLDGLVVYSLD